MTRLAGLALAASASLLMAAAPAPAPVRLPAQTHPESLSIAPGGIAYVGSARGGVLRVDLRKGTVEPFVAPGAGGSASIFGVLADARNRMLWVCSNDFAGAGIAVPGGESGHSVRGFDLRTGAPKLSLPLPGEKSLCNDMAVGRDGSLFVTDTANPRILRWTPGTTALETWLEDQALGPGLDGIAFGRDGAMLVNNIRAGALFRVAVDRAGMPGQVTKLALSRPLAQPDGMRPAGDGFVLAEGGGRVDRVTVTGDGATIEPIAEQLAGATGVDALDGTVWYVEGQLGALFDPAKRAAAATIPFAVTPVARRP